MGQSGPGINGSEGVEHTTFGPILLGKVWTNFIHQVRVN